MMIYGDFMWRSVQILRDGGERERRQYKEILITIIYVVHTYDGGYLKIIILRYSATEFTTHMYTYKSITLLYSLFYKHRYHHHQLLSSFDGGGGGE